MPFKTFVAGEILTASDVMVFLANQAIAVFADATARDAAITSPVAGQFAFRTDDDVLEYWDGSAWEEYVTAIEVDALVVGGGGGGGRRDFNGGGGGGAGGYFEKTVFFVPGVYPIVVGAGGAVNTSQLGFAQISPGVPSVFGPIVSVGGGAGGNGGAGQAPGGLNGASGGGGARRDSAVGGLGILDQGNNGGNANASGDAGGGGGGADTAGANAPSTTAGGAGGDGLSSSIDGTPTIRGGGGGGGGSTTGGSGGTGGGGNGAAGSTNAQNGSVNTGGGGGGGNTVSGGLAGVGGRGVVIFAVKTGTPVSFSADVIETNSTVGDKTVYVVTQTDTTNETVTIGNP